jgi:hypothetical protein
MNYLPYKCPKEGNFIYIYICCLDCSISFASRSALQYHFKYQHNKVKEKEIMKKLYSNIMGGERESNGHIELIKDDKNSNNI